MIRSLALQLSTLLILPVLSAGHAESAPIASAAEARETAYASGIAPRPFDFTGTVLSEGKRYWFFRDKTGGVEIHNLHPEDFGATRGSTVRVRGVMTFLENGGRRFLAESILPIGSGHLEPPEDATAAAILDGSMNYRFVRIKGVISSVVPDEVDTAFTWAVLRTLNGNVYLTFIGKWNNADALRAIVDAEVVATGLSVPMTGLRRNLGNRILIDRPDSLSIVKAPPEDPFAVPAFSDNRSSPHRQKVQGVVLASEPRRFFLKTALGRVVPVCPAAFGPPHAIPRAGDFATAVGFAVSDPYRTQLTDALLKIDGHAPVTGGTVRCDLKSLFVDDNGTRRIETHLDGTFISVRGHVRSVSPDELAIVESPYAVSLDTATLNMLGIPIPGDGSTVSVSGLCLAEFENPPTPTIYPTFRRFVLVPRCMADLTVLASPPWWTPFRLSVLLVVLATVLVGSALWNVLLNRKAEQRGQALYEEKIGHALAEQKVAERTHLAVELHDSISQTLTGVALHLDGGETETAKTMLASCRGELRRCLWDLRSRTFEEKDLTEAIRRTIAPHLNGCAVSVRFNVLRERISESLTHAILRIIRELVVNAIRHGRASRVRVAGEMHGRTVSFSVTDDGIGFDPSRAPGPEQGHFGLLGIRERIEDFCGDIEIKSAPNGGAKIAITLTVPEEPDERQNQDPDRR